MQKIIATIAIVVCASCPAHAWETEVIAVHDGDSITVSRWHGKIKVRLYGIDAPELDQDGGMESAAWLQEELPAGTRVDVKKVGSDRYGRTIGIVRKGTRIINAESLRAGQSWVYTTFCKRKECREWKRHEASARQQGRGLWGGYESGESTPVPPWEWRRKKRWFIFFGATFGAT